MPPRRRTYEDVVRIAEAVLRSRRIKHVFVGGIAVLAFGRQRATSDLDVIADYRPEDAPFLEREFRRHGFLGSAQDLTDALADRSHCTIEDTRSTYRIDLVPATDLARRDAIATSRRVDLGRRLGYIPVASPEHTIVMKLRYGSEQDVEDALAILASQAGRLDVRRMRGFARERGVLRELRGLELTARTYGVDRPKRRRGARAGGTRTSSRKQP